MFTSIVVAFDGSPGAILAPQVDAAAGIVGYPGGRVAGPIASGKSGFGRAGEIPPDRTARGFARFARCPRLNVHEDSGLAASGKGAA